MFDSSSWAESPVPPPASAKSGLYTTPLSQHKRADAAAKSPEYSGIMRLRGQVGMHEIKQARTRRAEFILKAEWSNKTHVYIREGGGGVGVASLQRDRIPALGKTCRIPDAAAGIPTP